MKPRLCLGEFTWVEPAIQSKNQYLVSGQLPKKLTSMSSKLEPMIWSRDTGQRIPCFDRCQLIKTWMSNCWFSLTWPTAMFFNEDKRKRLHNNRVKFPEDLVGAPTWPPFLCLGAPTWRSWRHVKTKNMKDVCCKLAYWSHWLTWRGGRTDVRTDGRWRHGYKTKISRIDGLPYFLNNGAPRVRQTSAKLRY